MKQNILKRGIVFLLSTVLLLSTTTIQAQAGLGANQVGFWGDMQISSSGEATVTVEMRAIDNPDKTILTCELQECPPFDSTNIFANGWKTIATWSESSNGNHVSYSKQITVNKNCSYRLILTSQTYKDGKLQFPQLSKTFGNFKFK